MVLKETKNDVYQYTCDEIEKSSPIVIDDVVDKNSNMEVQQSVWNLPSQINGNAMAGQSAVTTPTIKHLGARRRRQIQRCFSLLKQVLSLNRKILL